MDAPPELLSPRLRLRRLRVGDEPAVYAYRSMPEVARFQSWEPFTPEEAASLVAEQERTSPGEAGTWLQLALTILETGQVIGDCGVHFLPDDDRQVELGITLSPAHQGRGLATEAIATVLRYVFDDLGKHCVRAVTDAQNHPAARLFRRLGFREEGHFVEYVWFKGAWGSEFTFALLRREWEARMAVHPDR